MKWDILAVILFWILYGPLSFAIWGYTSNSFGALIAILSAGIGFTAMFLLGDVIIYRIKRKRAREHQRLIKEKMEILEQLENEETEPEADSEETEEVLEEKASAPLPVQESLD